MIEGIIAGLATMLLMGSLVAMLYKATSNLKAPAPLPYLKASDLHAPPPWAAPQFRCPNCSCKWCKFGAKE